MHSLNKIFQINSSIYKEDNIFAQVGPIPEIQVWFSIQNSIIMCYLIKRIKEKMQMVISIDVGEASDRFNHT